MSGGYFSYAEFEMADRFSGQWRDEELDEMFDDLFVRGFGHRNQGLVKTLDLWLCSDISEEDYREQVSAFKVKWLERTKEDRFEFYAQKLQDRCDELKKELGMIIHD